MGSTTWAATCGSGARIGLTIPIWIVCCGVLRGLTSAATLCCRRVAITLHPAVATAPTAFVVSSVCPRASAGRCLHFSLLPSYPLPCEAARYFYGFTGEVPGRVASCLSQPPALREKKVSENGQPRE